MITVNMFAVGGVILAALSLFGMFWAGSDAARIAGQSGLLATASTALMIAALILEYHA